MKRARGTAACPREGLILRRLRLGREALTADDEDHLIGCEDCRKVARVSSALLALSNDEDGISLPNPHQVLWRARILDLFARREAKSHKAARPLYGTAIAAVVLVVGLVFVTGLGLFHEVDQMLRPAIAEEAAQEASWSGLMQGVVAFGVAVLIAGISLFAQSALLDD